MYRKLLAVSLAVLMLLSCAVGVSAADNSYTVSNAEELKLLAQHPDAVFEIVSDIDFAGKTWTPVGTADQPFTGTIHGNNHEITNVQFADCAAVGLIAYNSGSIEDLNIFEYQANSSKAMLFGSLAAVNNGTIKNCTTTLGTAKLSASANAQIGQICAVNNGTVEKTVCAVDLTVSADESVKIGGLAAVNTGTITKSEAAGRMIITGNAAAGLLLSEAASGSLAQECYYTGTMATLDGVLMKTMLPDGNKSACLKDCLWRDNTSSLELLPEEAQQTRKRVLDYSNDLASIVWIAGKDIDYPEPDGDNGTGSHSKYYKQGEIWYGMEYSHRGKHLGTVSYSIGENDVLKDFLQNGPNGIDLYFTNDCSGTMVSCVQTVSPSVHATNTRTIQPGYEVNGFGDNHFLTVGPYVITEKARTSGKTADVYSTNSTETMKESWAAALPGDGANSSTEGHARLFVASKIMRDEKGIIDPDATIIYMNGMGDGIGRRLLHADIEVYGEYTLSELLENEWIPVTTKELKEGKAPAAEYSITDEGPKDRAHICQGIVHSNYALWGCRMRIFDASGKEVWEHTLWEKIYRYEGSNYGGRNSYYEFDLTRFATSFATANLTEGKTYTVKVTTLLADRGEYPVKEYSFQY